MFNFAGARFDEDFACLKENAQDQHNKLDILIKWKDLFKQRFRKLYEIRKKNISLL